MLSRLGLPGTILRAHRANAVGFALIVVVPGGVTGTRVGFGSAADQPAYGSYVHPTGTGPQGGPTYVVDFSGATFHNTSREEMNQWAADDFLPAMANAERQQRTAVGV